MKKIAIIGASYLQEPLISKAKDMGIETHVFAWACNDVGENLADYFYPISVVEKEEILSKCQEIGIDGICSIASDLAVVTVNYVAENMGLAGNGTDNTSLSTNKHNMRNAFTENGDPSPRSIMVHNIEDIQVELSYPVIVKPIDRSGSRGIFKVHHKEELQNAILQAEAQGFIKNALIEEFVEGTEYSIECVSYKGKHHFLAITRKYTNGSPRFVETGHLEPASVSKEILKKVRETVFHALDSLHIKNGASHSEVKIDDMGNIKIIEIGSRMGGDFIGSTLVYHSTGVDFVRAVIQIALGEKPDLTPQIDTGAVGIRYICEEDDLKVYNELIELHPEFIIAEDIPDDCNAVITDSSTRLGYFIMKSDKIEQIEQYMPRDKE